MKMNTTNIWLGVFLGMSGSLTLGSFIFLLRYVVLNFTFIPMLIILCFWIFGVIGTALVWQLAGERLNELKEKDTTAFDDGD